MKAQWGPLALQLFIQLGYLNLDLLESINDVAQERREEDRPCERSPDPSGGASEPIAGGKREAKPTAESKDARAARARVRACENTLRRLRLCRVEPPFDCGICGHQGRGMGLSCARALRS